ncbi:organic cation transporter protein-like [Anticarsia gemmatalis]|uniref:organic cation transporter protein-like n=1 Tax=Anticarsia gemmatalis TaxID=129554 RepID=UPI003F76E36B
MTVKPDLDIEQVLQKFSLTSPFYLKLFSLLVFAGVTNAFYSLNYVFAATDSRYRCKYPNCENFDIEQTLNITLDNSCHRFSFVDNQTFCSASNIDMNKLVKCDQWMYEDENTFVGEFNLGCEDWKRAFVGTVHSFGYMIGLLIMGPLADKIGRKKLVIITGLTAAFMGLGRSIAQSYWLYVSLELIEALFGDSYSSTFMLGVEMVTKENRVSFITLMTASTSLAGILMALTAFAIPYWRNFLRAIYAPALLFLFYAFVLDESFRWLLITGKKDEAKSVIRKTAKYNNVDITEDELDKIDYESENQGGNSMGQVLKMTLSSRKMVLRFCACVCMWVTALFNKYTLLINSVELEGNKYINFGLATFSELPASLALGFLLKRFKRKPPLTYSFLLTGVFCVAQSFVPKGHIILSTSLFLIGKFMATISYAIVYLYTSELFPTYTRNTMHSLCSSLGRTATMLAPQTPLLMRYWYGLPSVIVGGLSLITGLVVMTMPETAEDVLPDTVTQAENVGVRENRDNVTRF